MVGVLTLESSKVVHDGDDPAAGLAAIFDPAQTTSDHLHVPNRTEYSSGNEDHVSFGGIESGAQDRVIAENTDFPSFEPVEEIAPGSSRGFAADSCGGDTTVVESGGQFAGMVHRIGEHQNRLFRSLPDPLNQGFISFGNTAETLVD